MMTPWARLSEIRSPGDNFESFLSPDSFWILNIFIFLRPRAGRRTRRPFRLDARLELTSDGEKFIGSEYLNTTLDARRLFYPVRRDDLTDDDIEFVHTLAEPLIKSAKLWADRATHKIAAKILSGSSNFSKASRETLDSFLKEGSGSEKAKAANYIMLYLDRLSDRASSKNDSERRVAVQELGKFLNIYPSFRDRLPNELSVAADKLEDEGVLRHNPSRNSAKTMTASSMIDRCQKLWDQYYKKPTKKNLQVVFDHLEVMKSSKSEKVKKERVRCLRAANKEVARL